MALLHHAFTTSEKGVFDIERDDVDPRHITSAAVWS